MQKIAVLIAVVLVLASSCQRKHETPVASIVSGTQHVDGVNGWWWEETTNPMTDARTLIFKQKAYAGKTIGESLTAYDTYLGMIYEQGEQGGWFWAIIRDDHDGWMGSDFKVRDMKVTYRFGNAAAVTETFKMLNQGSMLYCPSKAVFPNDKLAVRVEDGTWAGVVFTFDLTGLLPTVEQYNKNHKKK